MTRPRTDWWKWPLFSPLAIILSAGVTACFPSAEEANTAAALLDAVTGKITAIHRFVRNSAIEPDKPPIKVELGQPPRLVVYEIKNRTEQDKVIAAVQAVMRDQKLRRVDLQFMDHENWVVDGNVGRRNPELQLRRVRVSQNGFQEAGGEKTITWLPKELQ